MKVADLDFFANRNYHSLQRIDFSTTLQSGVFVLTSGYVKSMLILVGFILKNEVLGGKVMLALDICHIYDEDIERRFNECGGTQEKFIEYLNNMMKNIS